MKSAAPSAPFTRYEKFIVAILAFVQFTVILDFMILSPLGALLMRDLHVSAKRFGLVVSVYAFSAGASAFAAAGFADRFDRKRLLLFFYVGFLVGTLLCGVAPDYHFLLIARMVTGLFAGVLSSISFAIIADLFPLQRRGRVMGVVQTSFAASQVLGIPLGLVLSNHWGWHAPFLLIVGISSIVGVVIAAYMRPIVGHLAIQKDRSAFAHLLATVSRGAYLPAYLCTMLLITGGFMIMPFASAFTVHNIGIPLEKLPIIYVVTGVCSIVLGPFVGRLSDRVGKFPIFCAGSLISMVMLLIYTHLGVTPLGLVMLVNVVLMAGISSRMIAASALTSAVPDAPDRGAFMAVSSSMQQLAGGIASASAGLIVSQSATGSIQHYPTLGYVAFTSMLAAMALLYFVNRQVLAAQQARVQQQATPLVA